MKNSQHLKAYVQMHPDNKMAWYLLGKEYYKNGQHGKANYCFNQAGEVYEAFEHSKVPADMLREYEQGLLQAGRERDRRRQRTRRVLMVLALLLLLLLPSAVAPGLSPAGEPQSGIEEAAAPEPAKDQPADQVLLPQATQVPQAARTGFTAGESGNAATSGKVMSSLLRNNEAASLTAVLGMKRSGKWLLWKEKLPLVATVEKTGDGRVEYQSYEAAVCACTPPDPGELIRQAAQWQAEQEDLAALLSAIGSYRQAKGKLPASLKELAAPFPGNWLGGTTPVMERKFAPLVKVASGAGQSASVSPSPAAGRPAVTPGSEAGGNVPSAAADGSGLQDVPFFEGPLKVIVDKQKHRLAVVSGSVMLRNYEVGLGGDKTPEGQFEISDKVVNPNGHDNGEFGSRGMQLSESNYAIHGTNEPGSIGKDESLGCIRMNREDVEELFALIPMGTKVQIGKGVLPEQLLLPEERYTAGASHNQTNPRKVYNWLN
ncbi:hypothetical protein GCM10010912_13860 [Paenibacillus albidus]|uniref:L,D-TPase catalytic domain-containing protein n=1 Tax=Paenibacillus albidus TaxID=2041023 RepID=A0A917C4N1_9BACL|nr:L,D-transpeptidase family protein [Paenibacillus albidus]GGF69885.1 hypothetical protein GCM10010912_13860 [Paenibacillus albidus]